MRKILCLSILGTFVFVMPSYSQEYNYQSSRIQPYNYQQENCTLSEINDLQNQLSSATEEINRLQSENYNLKIKVQQSKNITGAAVNMSEPSTVVGKLQEQLRQKNHEAQVLRQQLQVANSNLSQMRNQNYSNSSSNTCSTCKKKNFFKRIFRR